MHDEDYLDGIIKKVLMERIKRHGDTPDQGILWKRIEKEVTREEHTKNVKTIKRVMFSFAAILILSVGMGVLLYPGSVKAIGQKIHEKFNGVLIGDSITTQERLAHDENADGSPPPPDSVFGIRNVTLEELLKVAPYHICLPGYLPEGYALESAIWNAIDKHSGEAVIKYSNKETVLVIRQRNIIDDYASGGGADVDDTTVAKITMKNGITASMECRKKDGWCKLSWIYSDVFYQVSGKIKPDEIIKIAENLK